MAPRPAMCHFTRVDDRQVVLISEAQRSHETAVGGPVVSVTLRWVRLRELGVSGKELKAGPQTFLGVFSGPLAISSDLTAY